jgi:YVTN family beta-propeller protein
VTQRFGRLTWWWRLALCALGTLGGAICSVTAAEAYCAYVPDNGGQLISVIDTTTNSVSSTIAGDFAIPRGLVLTPDGRFLYIANRGWENNPGSTVSVIETSTNAVASTVPLTPGSGPTGVAIDPGGAFAYVAGQYSGTVMVLDTGKVLADPSHALVQTILVPAASALFGGPISPDGAFAYIGACGSPCDLRSSASLFIAVIDTSTNTVRTAIPGALTIAATMISPNGEFVYGPLPFNDEVVVTDTAKALTDPSHAVRANVRVGSFPFAIAVTPDGHFVYVANCGEYCLTSEPSSASTVSVIDTSTNKVLSAITLPPSSGPTGIAITPDGTLAYVTNGWTKDVAVIDTAKALTDPSHAVITNIAVGGDDPRGIVIGSVPGGCAGLNNPTPTLTPTLTRTPPTPGACIGDCNGNGYVMVDELVKGVNIALGTVPLGDCPQFDCNGTGHVTVDCLITGVNAALGGC